MGRVRVAILGSGGQVGSFLVRRLSELQGLDVVPVCRNDVSAGFIDAMGYRARVGSVEEIGFARRLIGDCEIVINCAIAVGLPRESRQLNEGIIDSIAQLPNVRRVVHFSSVAVYGSCIDLSRSTFEAPKADTDYGKEKLHIEKRAARAFSRRGLDYYLLRLGHVYGASQAMSNAIVTMLATQGFSLPFGGDLLSNAVHIERLGEAVVEMLEGRQPSGIYNLSDMPHQTWRNIFDWHSSALGLPVVGSMASLESFDRRRNMLRTISRPVGLRLVAESAQWLRSLPPSYVLACPALRDIGYMLLKHLPASIGRRIKSGYVGWSARRAVVDRRASVEADPWFFSDPMPGPYFPYVGDAERDSSMSKSMNVSLLRWHGNLASPCWDADRYIRSSS
ncbi:MAG: NAD-dependent epimerase/dehydratase family protein [Nitrospirota bacterium]